jgi:PAS domain S-box-containing protein
MGDHGVFGYAFEGGTVDPADRRLSELLAASTEAALDRAQRRETLTLYEDVLEAVQGMVFAVDPEGRFTLVTDPLAERLGRDRSELEGEYFAAGFTEAGVERAQWEFDRLTSGYGDAATFETELVTDDDGTIPVEIEGSLLPRGDDHRSGAVGVIRDRTELERTQDRLERERDRFSKLFEYLPDPINEVEFTDDGAVIRDANPAFEETFGYDREALADSPADRYLEAPAGDGSSNDIDERARNGEIVTEEIRRLADDDVRDFLFRGIPYRTDGRTQALGVYTDITDQKRRQRRLGVLNRVLRHNVRNEMTVVIGYAELLEAELGDDDRLGRAVEELHDAAREVSMISQQAREIEKVIQSDRQEPTDVGAVAAAAAEQWRSEHPEASVTTDLPEGLSASAGEGLELAVGNLVGNAVEHNPGDEPRVHVDAVSTGDGEVAVRVADDGPGIPDHERSVVTGDREVTQLEHGSGLGLWIVKWVAEAYGGRVEFGESDLGGAAVSVVLPAAEGQVGVAAED